MLTQLKPTIGSFTINTALIAAQWNAVILSAAAVLGRNITEPPDKRDWPSQDCCAKAKPMAVCWYSSKGLEISRAYVASGNGFGHGHCSLGLPPPLLQAAGATMTRASVASITRAIVNGGFPTTDHVVSHPMFDLQSASYEVRLPSIDIERRSRLLDLKAMGQDRGFDKTSAYQKGMQTAMKRKNNSSRQNVL